MSHDVEVHHTASESPFILGLFGGLYTLAQDPLTDPRIDSPHWGSLEPAKGTTGQPGSTVDPPQGGCPRPPGKKRRGTAALYKC